MGRKDLEKIEKDLLIESNNIDRLQQHYGWTERQKQRVEEYSKFVSIDFCQWVALEGYEMLLGCYAWKRPGDINSVSTEKLYELYLQSKSLVV